MAHNAHAVAASVLLEERRAMSPPRDIATFATKPTAVTELGRTVGSTHYRRPCLSHGVAFAVVVALHDTNIASIEKTYSEHITDLSDALVRPALRLSAATSFGYSGFGAQP
jgi:hypothetical protein